MSGLSLSPEQAIRVAGIVHRLHRSIARDVDVIASMVRVLENPKGPGRVHVERFASIVRGLIEEGK
jgi:hypothetical protein